MLITPPASPSAGLKNCKVRDAVLMFLSMALMLGVVAFVCSHNPSSQGWLTEVADDGEGNQVRLRRFWSLKRTELSTYREESCKSLLSSIELNGCEV